MRHGHSTRRLSTEPIVRREETSFMTYVRSTSCSFQRSPGWVTHGRFTIGASRRRLSLSPHEMLNHGRVRIGVDFHDRSVAESCDPAVGHRAWDASTAGRFCQQLDHDYVPRFMHGQNLNLGAFLKALKDRQEAGPPDRFAALVRSREQVRTHDHPLHIRIEVLDKPTPFASLEASENLSRREMARFTGCGWRRRSPLG